MYSKEVRLIIKIDMLYKFSSTISHISDRFLKFLPKCPPSLHMNIFSIMNQFHDIYCPL